MGLEELFPILHSPFPKFAPPALIYMDIYRLKNTIQHYAWGSKTFIPELMGESSPAEKPCAELWMGAHTRAPSLVIAAEGDLPLSELIRQNPEGMLGNRGTGRLPFLLKVLAAAYPLSIQAHPNIAQAREGYARENAAGILPDALTRNYKDRNHKPELICALTPFDALSGFRDLNEIAELLSYLKIDREVPGSSEFLSNPDANTFQLFFRELLNLSEKHKSEFLTHLARVINQAVRRSKEDELTFDWTIRLLNFYPDDIGAFAPILLNTVRLQPGEALYMNAGILHAYLNGAGIEIMANSDNVLRGGLTSKYVDIPELLKALSFTGSPTRIIRPETTDRIEFIYPTPAREFQLSRIDLQDSVLFQSGDRTGAEIILSLGGIARVARKEEDQTLAIKKGQSIFIPFSAGDYTIRGNAILYRAAIP